MGAAAFQRILHNFLEQTPKSIGIFCEKGFDFFHFRCYFVSGHGIWLLGR